MPPEGARRDALLTEYVELAAYVRSLTGYRFQIVGLFLVAVAWIGQQSVDEVAAVAAALTKAVEAHSTR